MKSIKTFVAVIALATSFGSFAAQTVTATGSTLESAEAKIAARLNVQAPAIIKSLRLTPVTACT